MRPAITGAEVGVQCTVPISRARCWLIDHPQMVRVMRCAAYLEMLCGIATAAAPHASAATNAAVLNWTGLHDSYQVPIGDFSLSMAALPERLAAGPDVTANPAGWAGWLLRALSVVLESLAGVNILTFEASIFVGVIALALWVLKLSVSTYWLMVFGEIAKAVSTAVIEVTTRWGLVAVAVPAGVCCGVLAHHRGEHGRGWTMIALAILMPGLAITVFSDPAGMMYGSDGLLAFGRQMAFSTAEAATHNGALGSGGLSGQVDTLTSSLITHVVREPLQLFNFGHVVDRVGGCGPAYSAALLRGSPDGPVQAMTACGDAAAASYAQHLDASNGFTGLVLVAAALMFGWFMVASGAAVFMTSVKALYTTAKVLPSVYAGGMSSTARQYAKSAVWEYFKYPIEVLVLVSFVSVMGLGVERLIAAPLPADLGGTSPLAHVVITAAASMTGLRLLRHIRADLGGRAPHRGLLGRGADVALGLGMHAALGGVGSAAGAGLAGLRDMVKTARQTPWERLDARSAADALGPPLDGFPVVPAGSDAAAGPGAAPTAPPAAAVTEPADAISATPATPGPDLIGRPATRAAETVGRAAQSAAAGRAASRRGSTPAGQLTFSESGDLNRAAAPAEVAPLTDTQHARHDSAGSSDHRDDDIPLPAEPPDDAVPPPPDDDAGAATVDPVTGP
jgi:hypothetical protein